LRKKLKSKKL